LVRVINNNNKREQKRQLWLIRIGNRRRGKNRQLYNKANQNVIKKYVKFMINLSLTSSLDIHVHVWNLPCYFREAHWEKPSFSSGTHIDPYPATLSLTEQHITLKLVNMSCNLLWATPKFVFPFFFTRQDLLLLFPRENRLLCF